MSEGKRARPDKKKEKPKKKKQCSRSWDIPLLVQEVSLAEYLHWHKFLQYKPLRAREELSGGLATFDLLTATDRRPAVAISTLELCLHEDHHWYPL